MLWKAWTPLSVTLVATAACRRQRGAGHARLAAEAPALDRVERCLARRAPEDAERSFCFAGGMCTLAAFGHGRDSKKDRMQIVYGLLCAADGRPAGVEVCPGNATDRRRRRPGFRSARRPR